MSPTTRDGTIVHCTCGRTYTFAPPEGDPGCECGRGPSGFFEGGEVPRELGYTIQGDFTIGVDHGAGPDRSEFTVMRAGMVVGLSHPGPLQVLASIRSWLADTTPLSEQEAASLRSEAERLAAPFRPHPAAFRDLAEDPDAPKVEINLGPFGGATPNRQQRRAAARRAR